MSRSIRFYADRTNQQLYFARLACQQAEQMQHENVQKAQAHREQAVFHLYGAFHAFLRELVRFYRLQDLSPTLQSIAQALAKQGQISPEINQLQALAEQGLLKQLNQAFHACLYTPDAPQAQPEQESALIIKAMQNEQTWLPDVEQLREWHGQWVELYDRFRAEMVEF
ncbi:MAG: hypothetical protein Q4D05_06235 [Acinetobacter sp.]|nr:hypothetical protein [Acinetobacter sp.]